MVNLIGKEVENFDRENNDELLEIRQIHQYFPLSKFCTTWYWSVMQLSVMGNMKNIIVM